MGYLFLESKTEIDLQTMDKQELITTFLALQERYDDLEEEYAIESIGTVL